MKKLQHWLKPGSKLQKLLLKRTAKIERQAGAALAKQK
jgi:hypothetical protein